MKQALSIVLILMFCSGVLFVAEAGGPCGYLDAGDTGQVTPGAANNVRSAPDPQAELLGAIPAGATFEVLRSANQVGCAESDYGWVEVNYEGLIGYTVEREKATDERFVVEFVPDRGPNLDDNHVVNSTTIEGTSDGQISFGGINLRVEPNHLVYAYEYGFLNRNNTQLYQPRPAGISFEIGSPIGEDYIGIDIFPAETYNKFYPGAADALRERIANRLITESQGYLPYTQQTYLDLGWGTAYRNIHEYTNGVLLRTGGEYTYSASGMTHDGQYVIAVRAYLDATIPAEIMSLAPNVDFISSENLGALEAINAKAQQLRHFEAVENHLQSLSPEDFYPSMNTVDTILGSISIEPGALAQYFNMPDEYALPPTEYGEYVPPPPPVPVSHCGTNIASLIDLGDFAQQQLQQDPIRVRDTPAGEYSGFDVQPYEVVEVTGGPVCAEINGETLTWWEVNTLENGSGWIVEGMGDRAFFAEFH